MALIDSDARPPVIWYYSVDLLPEDVSERYCIVLTALTGSVGKFY